MISLIVTLATWLPALLGIGILTRSILFPKQTNWAWTLGELGFLSLFSAALFGLLLHFALPLSSLLSALFWGAGVLSAYVYRADLTRLIKLEHWTLLLVTLATVVIAAGTAYEFDTGYYHLPSVTLASSHALPLGAANLHGPLGHPSTWFLAAAMLRLPEMELSGAFSLNAFLFIFFLTSFVAHLKKFSGRASSKLTPMFLLGVALFAPKFTGGLGGIGTDHPTLLLGIYVAFLLMEGWHQKEGTALELALLLGILAFTAKFSALPTCLAAFLVYAARKGLRTRSKIWVCFFAMGLGVAARGMLLSGCFAYPAPATCFHGLPWSISEATAQFWSRDILVHVFQVQFPEGFLLSDLSWVGPWLQTVKSNAFLHRVLLLAICGVFGVALALLVKPKRIFPKEQLSVLAFMLCFSAFGVLFWMGMAPRVRFGLTALMTLSLLCLSMARLAWGEFRLARWGVWAFLFVFLGLGIRSSQVSQPVSTAWGQWPLLPQVKSEALSSSIGTKPEQGVQCWDLQQPCNAHDEPVTISYQDKRLILRRTLQ